MAILVVINGESSSGKDTFVELFREMYPLPVANIHSSDSAKKYLKCLGWNGEKTEGSRNYLADLIEMEERHGYIVPEKLSEALKSHINWCVVFYHQRNPQTIQKIKKLLKKDNNVSVTTLLIKRPQKTKNEIDRWGIEKYGYDTIVENTGSLEDLKRKAQEYMKRLEELR